MGMKANEFVKKWGVEAVIERLANAPESATVISGLTCMFFKQHSEDGWSQVYMTDIGEGSHTRWAPIINPIDIKELKRLVESHDLIERVGGLERAKSILLGCERYGRQDVKVPVTGGFIHISYDFLKRDVADVEACQ